MLREPAVNDIEEFENLYRRARFLDAHARLAEFAPPESWTGTRARLIIGRTFHHLGAPVRSRRLLQATWRRDRADSAALYYFALGYTDRHGPFEALRLLSQHIPTDLPAPSSPRPEAHLVYLWLLRARCLAQFRDFEAAEAWLAAAEAAAPDDPWTYVERASIRERADRYDEALASAEQALKIRPNYRPAIESLAHLLVLRNRDAEAIALLRGALESMQSVGLAMQLAVVLAEEEDFAAALDVLALAGQYSPLAEKGWHDWVRARQADALYRLGRVEEAAKSAAEVPGSYYKAIAERLATPAPAGQPTRIQLRVGFVRQHYLTCSPATIAAVSAYWGRPIDHLALAQVITYDGTPDHEERHWLETHGWHVREFRVTWEIALKLLERGIPFTVVTTWTGGAHLQAVIGCDPRLGTFVIRDPYHRTSYEALATEFLQQQAPYGPRGMILLVPAEAHRLDGIELPDAELYDGWFRLRRALAGHDRAAAAAEAEACGEKAPGHRLALWSQRQLAYYDENPFRIHESVLALRAMFPDEANLQFEELGALQRLGRRTEYLDRLRTFALKRGADPAFWRDYAEHLRSDAREHARARRYAWRLVRVRPLDWPSLYTFAHVLWDEHRYGDATQVYRLAATLGEKAEPPWHSFFAACRHQRRTDEAVALLEARAQRLSAASADPVQTLYRCLEQLDRGNEARAVLSAALVQRPDDGDLLLAAAEAFGRTGEFDRAAAYLMTAEACTAPLAWRRTAAQVASWRADHAIALAHWQAIRAANPLDVNALRHIPRLLAMTSGRERALGWLNEQVIVFPHFLPLRTLRLEWLRGEPAAAALSEVEDYLKLHPTDAWGLREKALILVRTHQPENALETVRLAEQIDPHAPASPGTVGQVMLALHRFDDARAATEHGLQLSIDADWLMPQLIEACPEFAQRRAAVEFLRQELTRQASTGSAYLKFHEVAIGVFAPDELHRVMGELRTAQPDVWETWSASVAQSLAVGRPSEALELAEEETRRFPLVPRAWLDLADVRRDRNEPEPEAAALVRARELSPGWAAVCLRLASLHTRALRSAEAEEVLRSALAHDPLNAELLIHHARVLWQLGRADEALRIAERAATLAPDYGEPWRWLEQWRISRGEAAAVVALARRIAEQRPGDPAPRVRLARQLAEADKLDEALVAADAALVLAPAESSYHDLRASLLALAGRYDEALAACAPAVYEGHVPVALRGRAAWIEWRRGNRGGAIEQIRGVVAADPDYIFGWERLAEWLETTGDVKAATAAAENLVALAPNAAPPLGYLADLKIRAGNNPGAIADLRRALRLNPAYTFAAFTLLRLACDRGELEDAEHALAQLRKHASHWQVLRCEAMLHRARRNREALQKTFRELCHAPEHATEELNAAANLFVAAGWFEALATTLGSVVGERGVNPEVGAWWLRARLEAGGRIRLGWLDRHATEAGVRRSAWRAYLEWLGEKKYRWRLRYALWRRGPWLHTEDATWGAAGYALHVVGAARQLAHWMRDWDHRPNAAPWMLQNLGHSLLKLGRVDEVERITNVVLQRPADHTRPMFVAWAALLRALRGDLPAATRALSVFDAPARLIFAKVTAEQARALVAVAQAAPESRREVFRAERQRLKALTHEQPGVFAHAYMRRQQLEVLAAMAQQAGASWRRRWYRLPAAFTWLGPVAQGGLALTALLLLIAAIVALVGYSDAPFGALIVAVWIVVFAARGMKRR